MSSILYANGYPCAYGMSGNLAIQTDSGWKEIEKNGSSWHIANRKAGAFTYFPKKPRFTYVLVLDPSAFSTKADLYSLDQEFVEYIKGKGLGHLYIEEAGGKEWFYVSPDISYLKLRIEFFERKHIPILAVLEEDPFPIHDLHTDEKRELEEEDRTKSILSTPTRLDRLIQFQATHIDQLREFLRQKETEAAMAIAVCGYGKTVVASKSLKGLIQRCFICVPTEHLKRSWKKALIAYGGFLDSEIFEIGSENLTTILQKPRFALLLCYASSHLLQSVLNQRVELGIFDEAHRLAGIAELSDDDSERKQDVGRTKRLIQRCGQLHIPRLSLTYTPKSFLFEEEFQGIVNSNDDIALFGEAIVKVSLREMIDAKLLPPYEIRFPYVRTPYEGTKAKVQLLLHEFMKQENGVFPMNHCIAFGATHEHCKEILNYLKELIPQESDIELVYLDSASSVPKGLARFEQAKRSILINCKLLGEGVDIPIADSVCLLCSRRSYTEIVQMLLRPGRFHPDKKKFYMIMTINDEEDTQFVGYTLDALAQMDPLLDKQLLQLSLQKLTNASPSASATEQNTPLTVPIQSESADGHDLIKIRQCLEVVVRRRFGSLMTRAQFDRLRRSCQTIGIRNTSEYNALREQYGWHETPWSNRQMTAYEFFHGVSQGPMTQESFMQEILNHKITYEEFFAWQVQHPEYPSVEDITDGYFGQVKNLQDLFPQVRRRR